MRSNLSRGLMLLGLALILGAAALVVHNNREAETAGERSAQVLQQLQQLQEIQQLPPSPDPQPTTPALPESLAEQLEEMPTMQVDGRGYLGTLWIPSLELQLPVLAQWSYDGLRTAPCRYSGSIYTGNFVLCGHSYDTHFGRISRLQPGELVVFTTVDGTQRTYLVALQETLGPTAIEEMTAGTYPLTLFTCTRDSQNRVTVRCIALED